MMISVSNLGSFTRKRKFLGFRRKGVYPYEYVDMAGKNLKRQVYHRKMHFTAGLI